MESQEKHLELTNVEASSKSVGYGMSLLISMLHPYDAVQHHLEWNSFALWPCANGVTMAKSLRSGVTSNTQVASFVIPQSRLAQDRCHYAHPSNSLDMRESVQLPSQCHWQQLSLTSTPLGDLLKLIVIQREILDPEMRLHMLLPPCHWLFK